MQWKPFVCCIALLFVTHAHDVRAQESYDSLLKQADAARSSNPKRFTELLAQLRASQRGATTRQQEYYKYLQAYEVAIYQDELGKGAELAKQLYNEAKDVNLKYRAAGLAASFYAINRDLNVGLRYLQKAMAMRKQVTDKAMRHEGVANGALLYNEIGQHAIALRYARELLAETPNPRMQCIAGQHRIISEYELKQLPKNDVRILEVIAGCEALNEFIAANLVRGVLAKKYAMEGRADKAIELLRVAMPQVESTRYPRLIADIHSIIAEIELKLGNTEAARQHAQASVDLGEQIVSSSTLVSAYNTLYEIAAAKEKPSVALDLYKRYAESKMAHQSDVKARELAYEIVVHETQQKSKEIELLQAQQRLERENTQKAQLTTLFLAILLAGIVFWAFQVKRHQHQLKKLAQTDSLTGLGNRHYFTQKSERALVEAARAGEPASLVMFDLDHFKAINDTYGHGAGDWVLKQVGKTCSSHCRKIDYIGRIGGEEFAVLLRGIDLAAAERLAENCRAQLAQIDTRDCGYSFVVTGSFGVSSTAQSGYDLSRLLSHADQMLYRAKNEGRNRVCAYTAEAAADYRSVRRAPSLSVVNR